MPSVQRLSTQFKVPALAQAQAVRALTRVIRVHQALRAQAAVVQVHLHLYLHQVFPVAQAPVQSPLK